MFATETDLWGAIHAHVTPSGWFAQRFEDSMSLGIPDAFLAADGVGQAWVELKIHPPVYRKGQLPWALDAAKRGQRVITLVADPSGFYLLDQAAEAHRIALGDGERRPLARTKELGDALRMALGAAPVRAVEAVAA